MLAQTQRSEVELMQYQLVGLQCPWHPQEGEVLRLQIRQTQHRNLFLLVHVLDVAAVVAEETTAPINNIQKLDVVVVEADWFCRE